MVSGKDLARIIIQGRSFFIGKNGRVFFSFTVSSIDHLKHGLKGLESLIEEVFCDLELFDLRIDRVSCCGDSKVLFISAEMTTGLAEIADKNTLKGSGERYAQEPIF